MNQLKKLPYAIFFLFLIIHPSLNVYGEVYIPYSLNLTIYTDGRVKVDYIIECEITSPRVDVNLFGSSYSNLVIRDEEGNPLDSSTIENGVKVDSLGAEKVTFSYLTNGVTSKEGPIWSLNITTPVDVGIRIPHGASIIDLSDIPKDIGIKDELQYLVLPSGDVYIYYIIGLPDVVTDARNAIEKAIVYVSGKESEGYILINTEEEIVKAQIFFEEEKYSEAINTAEHVITITDSIIESAASAASQIDLAQTALTQANEEGRTLNLEVQRNKLSNAKSLYEEGEYIEAEVIAAQVYQQSLNLNKPSNNILFFAVVTLVVIVVAYLYFTKYRRIDKKGTGTVQSNEIQVKIDLDTLFWKHDNLRLEDKEVIKFLASTGGEGFATEIRDRFDLPRSTAWRLIRRLVNEDIVEEIKVGNQSLVRIREEYRHK
ncbi:MAG: helix-turn-helix transcriptional regulator [Candidatus Heimdallarchaeaceae archaeon]|jgi:uncharacterized membrane protein